MRVRIVVLLSLVLAAVPAASGRAVSKGAVVSQVYGGGGNSGAPYSRDFIELFNRSKTSIDVSTWHVQYSPSSSDHWTSTALTGSIAPYRYYLVALVGGSSGGAALPTPDATGSTNMSGSAGKVRIVDGAGTTVDLVGYGTGTTGAEGRAAPGASDSKTSVTRKRGGCTDSDNNASDFEVAAVKPHNHSSPADRCDSPPALNTIGNRAVHAGSQLSFTLSAWDPDGDPLTYSASGLPSGSTFYPDSRTFAWRPTSSNVGTFPGVKFSVSDGFSVDSETITIGVAPASASGPSTTTLHVTRSETGVLGSGTVSPDHRGFEVVVRLLRKSQGAYVVVAEQRPILDANSTYHVSFARAPAGYCRIRAKFKGDDLHDASAVAVPFRC